MGQRKVNCAKYGEELVGLDAPPFEGELGQAIYEGVSEKAWLEWKDDMMIKIINEYRLNLAEAEHYETLLTQMRAFLNLSDDSGEKTELLEVENEDRGRSE